MDKEKETENMTKKIDDFCSKIDGKCEISCSKCLGNFLVGEGYGNVEQAVKEFAEKLKGELWKFDGSWQEYDGQELCETVDNLITELYDD